MTEDEAKTKWCPQRSIAGSAQSNWDQRCIGSTCMAWRPEIERDVTQATLKPEGDGWEKDGPERGAGGGVTHRQSWKRHGGHCGLAGDP